MQNKVPHLTSQDTVSSIDQAINRSLRGVRQTAADEVNRLVESALVLIQRSERLEPRVSEIVKQAGLHNQAFYRHFRSKRELLVAVLDRGIAILASYLRHRMEGASTAEGEVREWFRGMLEQALAAEGAEATRPFALARGRLAESYPDEVARSEQQLTALLRDTIVRAQARGELLAADPDRAPEALYLLAMGWIERRLREASPPTREDAIWLEEFALAGLTGAGDTARTKMQ
jgi:AcrR family transcriptional regulator